MGTSPLFGDLGHHRVLPNYSLTTEESEEEEWGVSGKRVEGPDRTVLSGETSTRDEHGLGNCLSSLEPPLRSLDKCGGRSKLSHTSWKTRLE